MKTIGIIIAAALLAPQAHARLGETEAEIVQRYGKVLQESMPTPGMPLRLYEKSGMSVVVAFIEGHSAAEFLTKKPKADFSETEVLALLAANSQGDQWKEKLPFASGQGMWRLEASMRNAILQSRQLVISTDEFMQRSKRETAEAEKAKLKGF